MLGMARTLGAHTVELQEVAADTKAETSLQLALHAVGGTLVKIYNLPALRADEMMVAALSRNVRGPVLPHVDGADDSQLRQQFQRSVDGRAAGMGMNRLGPPQNLAGVEMFALA